MPVLTVDELKHAVITGQVSGFTVDTSVYESYNFGFEIGVLARLSQMNASPISFLMVDVIRNEIVVHLQEKAKNDKSQLKNALKNLPNTWGTSQVVRKEVFEQLFGDVNEAENSERRVVSFENITGAELIKVSDYDILALAVNLYFTKSPPFSEKKKNEFPDAFALLAIEEWAKHSSNKVVAVSKDGDWKEFCENSEHIIYVEDLSLALSAIQTNAVDAVELIRRLVVEGELKHLKDTLWDSSSEQSYKFNAHAIASSSTGYDDELVDLISYEPKESIEDIILTSEVVEYIEGQSIVLRVTFNSDVEAQFYVTFYTRDGVDRDYIPISSGKYNDEKEVGIEALVTFSIEDGSIEVSEVEIIGKNLTFNLGEIDPWDYDRPDYDDGD